MDTTELTAETSRTREEASPANGTALIDTDAPRVKQVNPLAPDDGRYVTLEEYWKKWYENPYPDIDISYEWNNGRLEAKPLANQPQLDLGNWFLDLLRRYRATHAIADLINTETGFLLTIEDFEEEAGFRRAVRKPDIGVILHSNPAPWGDIDQRSFAGVCDAVVEFLSDSTLKEVRRDTEEKKRDYALAGVKEYAILDPSGEHMRFYRLAPGRVYAEIEPDARGVIQWETLPGFQFRLEDLARVPDIVELARDEIYSGYVIPDLQIEATARQRAERAAAANAQLADANAQRADANAQRADANAQLADANAQRADAEAAARQRAEGVAAANAQRADANAQLADANAQRADTEAAGRQHAEERIQALEAEMAARQQTEEERIQALVEAELARLRGQDS